LFSKLEEFKGLKSLKLNVKFGDQYFPGEALKFFKEIKLPVGLEVLELDLAGIEIKEESCLKVADFKWIFWQIEQMKELKALKLYFGMNSADKKSINDFVSLLPRELPKLEVLFTYIRVKEQENIIHTNRAFEWAQSHPIVRNVQLDLPLLNYVEIEKKKPFDYEMKHLESLGLSISHEEVVIKDYFEDFLVFLTRQVGLKRLNLRVETSYNYAKTMELINKYLQYLPKLGNLKIEFMEYEGNEFEGVLCLKPLMKKVGWFNLHVETKKNKKFYDEFSFVSRKLFDDEKHKKGKRLEISLNKTKLV